MQRLRISGIMLALFVFSLSIAQVASASPISPPSAGCQASAINSPILGTGYTLSNIGFYDDDTLTLTAGAPVNVHLTNSLGLDRSANGVTKLGINMPRTALYTLSITPVSGTLTHITLACTSTPLSGGCIDTDFALAPGGVSVTLHYDAGEYLHVGASGPVQVHVSGAVTANFSNVSNWTFIIPVSGVYNVNVVANPQAGIMGLFRCSLPR